MGTKNNPGSFDCYANAEPDEPMFTLLARDPLAPGLVRIWAALRSRHPATAMAFLTDLVETARTLPVERPHKSYEALTCSDDMVTWRSSRFAPLAAPGSSVPSAASATPSSESTATPNADAAAE